MAGGILGGFVALAIPRLDHAQTETRGLIGIPVSSRPVWGRRWPAMDHVPVEAFLDPFPDDIRATAYELRRLVKGAVPDAVEGVRLGWRLVGYSVPVGRRTRYFAAIGPEQKHCHLFFEYGIFLDDPQGLLEGAELKLRQVRYLTFRTRSDVARIGGDVIQRLTADAGRLAGMSREQRLAMSLARDGI